VLTESALAHEKAKLSYLQALAMLHYLIGNDQYPFAAYLDISKKTNNMP
jgi:hypothetical protein